MDCYNAVQCTCNIYRKVDENFINPNGYFVSLGCLQAALGGLKLLINFSVL